MMKSNLIFVDTSGWIGLFVKNDSNYETSKKIFKKIIENKIRLLCTDYYNVLKKMDKKK